MTYNVLMGTLNPTHSPPPQWNSEESYENIAEGLKKIREVLLAVGDH